MISTVIHLQNENNVKTIGKDWLYKNVAWDFTIFTETAELVDSLGLKWWKNCKLDIKSNSYLDVINQTEFDIDNVKIELVDLLHFVVSNELTKVGGNGNRVTYSFNQCKEDKFIFQDNAEAKLNILKYSMLFVNSMSIQDFVKLTNICGFTMKELYALYIKKSALNMFRQNNGYKDGTYSKIWDGREDNEYLHDLPDTTSPREIYIALDKIYKEKVIKT